MKTIIRIPIIFFLFFTLLSCGAQVQKQAQTGQTGGDDKWVSYYTEPTSTNGLYMRAKIDGKDWIPNKMTIDPKPDDVATIEGFGGNYRILFYIDLKSIKTITTRKFEKGAMAQLFDENYKQFDGIDGEYVITSSNQNWIEGRFHFTANGTMENAGQKHVVTDGVFRLRVYDALKKRLHDYGVL